MIFFFLFWLGSLAEGATLQPAFSLEQDLGGKESFYTRPVLELLRHTQNIFPSIDSTKVHIQCISHPSNPFYIGIEQAMEIDAPLSRVAAVIDDFPSYSSFVKDSLVNEVRSREGNKFTVFSEQHIGIPFVQNDRTEMQVVVVEAKNKRSYRFQLKAGNHLKFHDGLVVLEALGKNKTRFLKFNFWDADWGLAKVLAPKGIWKESIKGLYQSDIAFKLIAEHEDWSLEKVAEVSTKEANLIDAEALMASKKTLDQLFATLTKK